MFQLFDYHLTNENVPLLVDIAHFWSHSNSFQFFVLPLVVPRIRTKLRELTDSVAENWHREYVLLAAILDPCRKSELQKRKKLRATEVLRTSFEKYSAIFDTNHGIPVYGVVGQKFGWH